MWSGLILFTIISLAICGHFALYHATQKTHYHHLYLGYCASEKPAQAVQANDAPKFLQAADRIVVTSPNHLRSSPVLVDYQDKTPLFRLA